MSLLDEGQPEASACPQKEQPVSNFVVQAYEPTKKLFKQPIGRPKMRKHGRPRAPRVGDDMTGQPWHIVEKTKLLTAIRRFGFENVEVLSDMVKTRSKDEVETFIKKINSDAPRPTKKKKKAGGRQRADPIIKKSPIELWSELIHEITINEPYDFSQDVSKVFNMIAKFEEFQPSGLPRLNWKKMYQFLADLLEDKAELQELSDVESHILIDMMQGLGDVLHSSDTHLQHRLLTLKFSMLDGDGTEKTSNPRRQDSINRAFNNDFDYKGDGTYTGPRRKAAFRKSRESSESGSVKEESIGAGPSRAADETDDDIAEFKKPQLFTLNPLCIPTSLLPLKPRVDYFDS